MKNIFYNPSSVILFTLMDLIIGLTILKKLVKRITNHII